MSLLNNEDYYSGGMDNISEDHCGMESIIGFHSEAEQSTNIASDPSAKVHGLGQSDVTIDIPSKFKHCPACNPKSLKVVRGSGKKGVSGGKKPNSKGKKKAAPKKVKAKPRKITKKKPAKAKKTSKGKAKKGKGQKKKSSSAKRK